MEMIYLLIFLSAQIILKIHQINVKFAFLSGYLEEKVYFEQALSFVVKNHEDKTLRLKKILYGMKKALQVLNSRIDKCFKDKEFIRCLYEYAFYIKVHTNIDILLVFHYVDDISLMGNNPSLS